MGIVGIKKKGQEVEYIQSEKFSKDNKEEHLQKIVENNPKLVMDELNSKEGQVLTKRKSLPNGKEPDIVYCDSRGSLTIIELKKDKSPRKAIVQLFDYASTFKDNSEEKILNYLGEEDIESLFQKIDSEIEYEKFESNFEESLEKPQLVLVSYRVGDDVLRITRWLRDQFDLKVNCVDFDYYKADGREVFIPKVIGAQETREIKDKELKPHQRKYKRFYTDLIDRLEEKISQKTIRNNGSISKWENIGLESKNFNKSEVHLEWVFKGKSSNKRFLTAIDFELESSSKNKELMNQLIDHFGGLEELKEILDVENIEKVPEVGDTGTRSRIYTVFENAGSLDEIEDYEELKKWAVNTLASFYNTFHNEIDKL
jgi:hypothetical protein